MEKDIKNYQSIREGQLSLEAWFCFLRGHVAGLSLPAQTQKESGFSVQLLLCGSRENLLD